MPQADLHDILAGWHLDRQRDDLDEQVAALLEPLCQRGLLPDGHESTNAVLMGEQYHLGGSEDTRRMADLADIASGDRVIDLACYVGGPARQLARDYGCTTVGVDLSEVHIAIAERLTELTDLHDRVTFLCASADDVPLPDRSFTMAWSQCPMPSDLSWLKEMDRLLTPGGRLAFTGLIRRPASDDPDLLTLDEISARVREMGYAIVCTEDISDMDLEHGWLPALERLNRSERHYAEVFGAEWVTRARGGIETDIAHWREGRLGNGRMVAVKG